MSEEMRQRKQAAAKEAVKQVEPEMVVGLGHGSTAIEAVREIARRFGAGELVGIRCVPCSLEIEDAARHLGLPLTTLDQEPEVDLTIDGADEVSASLDLIKGGGGALLREKIVAQASKRELIIVDDSKLSRNLGEHWAVPVEVMVFGLGATRRFLEGLGAKVSQRMAGEEAFITDQGNFILDCDFGPMSDPASLAAAMNGRAGVVEHGLFLGIASEVIVAGAEGVRRLTR